MINNDAHYAEVTEYALTRAHVRHPRLFRSFWRALNERLAPLEEADFVDALYYWRRDYSVETAYEGELRDRNTP